jgi:hypothetical protein
MFPSADAGILDFCAYFLLFDFQACDLQFVEHLSDACDWFLFLVADYLFGWWILHIIRNSI